MTLIEQLKAIRALIDAPEKWTQGAMARDKGGSSTYEIPDAVCYCLMGANLVIGPGGRGAQKALVSAMPDSLDDLPGFNDHPDTTHADVMGLIDRAIEAEQAA